jgi:tripartite-type tricarboxylate transporter receptor subunit TctC
MKFARWALVLAVAMASGPSAAAEPPEIWPARPIRLVTPYAAGGVIDVIARILADKLTDRLGQRVVVDNKPGANGIIGAEAVAKAAPDGYTILTTTSSAQFNNPALYASLPYDADKDFAPITQVCWGSVLLVADINFPANDMKEFVAFAKTRGKPTTYGSWGVGSAGHLFGELLRRTYGLDLVHVVFKGEGPAILELRGGQLDATFASPNAAKPQVAASVIKALGMTGPRRSPGMPRLPTFAEQGLAGFDLAGYQAVYAPAGTPRPIVERLQRELVAIIRMPEVEGRLLELGQIPIGSTIEAFEASIREEAPKWRELVKASGAHAE